jgi:tetratricopeptide (TPR) repeat protein
VRKKILIAIAIVSVAQIAILVGISNNFYGYQNLYRWEMRRLFERLGLPREPFRDPTDAREQTSAALRVNKDDIYALRTRAQASSEMQMYDSAIRDYDHLIELQPSKAEWYEARSLAYLNYQVSPERALQDVEKAITISGLDVHRLLLRGKAFLSLDRKIEAKKDFDKILNEYKGDQVDLATYFDLFDQYLAVFDSEGAARALELAAAKKDGAELSFFEKQRRLAEFYLKSMDYERAAKLYEALVTLPDDQLSYSDLLYHVNLLAAKGDTERSAKFKTEAMRFMTETLKSDICLGRFVDMSMAATLLKNLKLDGRQADYDTLVEITIPMVKKVFEGGQSVSEYEDSLFYLLSELPTPKARELAVSLIISSGKINFFCYDETSERLAEYVGKPQSPADKSPMANVSDAELELESTRESLTNFLNSPDIRWRSAMCQAALSDPNPIPYHISEQARRALRASDKVSALKLALHSFAMAPDKSDSAGTLAKVAWSCGDKALAKKGLEALLRHAQIDGDQAFMLYQLALKEKRAGDAAKYLRLSLILGNDQALVIYRKKHKGLGVARRY